MKKLLLVVLLVSVSACDIVVTGPTVTNTNTNTNTVDVHDIGSFSASPNPNSSTSCNTCPGGSEVPVNIPSGSQAIVERVAAENPTFVARACKDPVYGYSFLDASVSALQKFDPRWGYLIKTTGSISRDVVAYRATSDNTGAWAVDIIIDCDGVSKSGWSVIGFDPAAQWSPTRF